MLALNAGIHSGNYPVRFQAPHLGSIEFGGVFSSFSLSSVHLQLWLHLYLGNRTSALQRSSRVHSAGEVGVVRSKPRPSALLHSAKGGLEKVAAAPPAPPSARSSGSACSSRAAWCGAAAAPPSPGAPAGPHKVCSLRPCTAELPERCCSPARRVGGDPPLPMLHGQTGACRENFEKLPGRNLLLHLASWGPQEEPV